jgi:FixJ family two-component response regulator
MTAIALVDDDADVMDATEYFVGAKCDKFTDALAFSQSDLSKYKVVITDYTMPDMDGCKLAKALRERGFTELIILISGKDKSQFCAESIALFDDILAKPPAGSDLQKLKFIGFCYGGTL